MFYICIDDLAQKIREGGGTGVSCLWSPFMKLWPRQLENLLAQRLGKLTEPLEWTRTCYCFCFYRAAGIFRGLTGLLLCQGRTSNRCFILPPSAGRHHEGTGYHRLLERRVGNWITTTQEQGGFNRASLNKVLYKLGLRLYFILISLY